jgi:hypothetical protein
MLDQMFEMSRKAMEASLQMQQAMFKPWMQGWPSMSPISAGPSADVRKQWVELVLEALNKHRESIDSNYRAAIQALEKTSRVPEAKSSEDAVRAVDDVWRTLFETLKGESEAQFRQFQSWTEKALEIARQAIGQPRAPESDAEVPPRRAHPHHPHHDAVQGDAQKQR